LLKLFFDSPALTGSCDIPAFLRRRCRAKAAPFGCSISPFELWSPHPDLNRGPLPYQGSALPLSYVGNSHSVFKHNLPFLERVMGIEPTSSAWKAEVLPLNYTRLFFFVPAARRPNSGAQKF
jgi:hypothetical protein